MGLRAKFLIIMLVFSIGPLLALFLINQRVFLKLGDDIFHIAKVMLFQTTAKELQVSAENYAANFNREIQFIEKGMRACRDDLEGFLEANWPVKAGAATQWVFDAVRREIPGYHQKLAAFHNDLTHIDFALKDGARVSYPATADYSSEALVGDILATLEREIHGDDIQWRFPQMRPLEAGIENELIAILPIHKPDGTVLGIFAAGFDIAILLEAIRPSSQWSIYTTSLLLSMGSKPQPSSELPIVIGSRRPSAEQLEWKTEAARLQLDATHMDGVQALFQGAQYGQEGYVSLPYAGEASIWAFAHAGPNLGIVNILPEREILYRIARHPGRFSRWLTLDSFLAVASVVLIMLFVATHRSKRMLTPFFSMVSSFKQVSEGDFSARLAFKARDERQMVADAFNTMVTELEEGMRARQALEVAQEVQQNFVPETAPRISGLDVAAKVSYCEETGGDYIDVLDTSEGKIGIVVGDVTGHGIGAALLMATVRALIRAHYETNNNLAQVIDAVNRNLAEDMGDTGRFVTLFIIDIDQHSRQLRWVRAGHDPAWLFSARNGSVTALNGPGMALGVFGEYDYSESTHDGLVPGDIILIGTDGIWETANAKGDLYGKRRLEATVQVHADSTAVEICDAVMQAINQFRGEEKQEDDVSVIVAKVLA